MAKGMGNGFPVGGILISDKIEASYGMLGTTFGGNHLACAAVNSVLEVMDREGLMENVKMMNKHFLDRIREVEQVKNIKGKGLMLGASFNFKVSELRKRLIYDEKVFTGGSSDPYLLRILPPLCISTEQIDFFIEALKRVLKTLENE